METFKKRYIVERTNKAEIRPEEQWERGELLGEFMEQNTVERAIKTERDTKSWTKRRGQAKVGLCQKKHQHNTHLILTGKLANKYTYLKTKQNHAIFIGQKQNVMITFTTYKILLKIEC